MFFILFGYHRDGLNWQIDVVEVIVPVEKGDYVWDHLLDVREESGLFFDLSAVFYEGFDTDEFDRNGWGLGYEFRREEKDLLN